MEVGFAVEDVDMDGSNGLFGGSASRPGDSGDGDGEIGSSRRTRALGHRLGDGLADRTMGFEHRGVDPERGDLDVLE